LGSGFPEKLVLDYRRFDAQIGKPASNTEVVVNVTPEIDAAAKVKKSSEGALPTLNHEIADIPSRSGLLESKTWRRSAPGL
jgi:hypothetical protein